MSRRQLAAAAIVAASALPLASCADAGGGSWGHRDQAVCVDPDTGVRVPDYDCGSSGPYTAAPAWWYFTYGYAYPAVGVHITHVHYHYVTHTPSGGYVRGGAATSGGRVTSTSLRRGTAVGFHAPAAAHATAKATSRADRKAARARAKQLKKDAITAKRTSKSKPLSSTIKSKRSTTTTKHGWFSSTTRSGTSRSGGGSRSFGGSRSSSFRGRR